MGKADYTPLPRVEFKPEYCDMIVKELSRGKSAIQVAASIGIGKSTFWRWLDSRPDFKEAYDIGMVKAEAFWTDMGEANMENPNFNFVYYNRVMGSRFGSGGMRKVRKHYVCCDDKSLSIKQRFKKTLDSIADDEVTAEEIEKLSTAFVKIAEIEERTDIVARVEALESGEIKP